jgi:hypothetical protein
MLLADERAGNITTCTAGPEIDPAGTKLPIRLRLTENLEQTRNPPNVASRNASPNTYANFNKIFYSTRSTVPSLTRTFKATASINLTQGFQPTLVFLRTAKFAPS